MNRVRIGFNTLYCAEQEGKEVQLYTQSIEHSENRRLIRDSYICPDFRSDWHLQCGYIPCRIQKNISYGRIPGTNSPFIKEAFGDYVVFGGTPETLYNNLVQAEKGIGGVNMREACSSSRTNTPTSIVLITS